MRINKYIASCTSLSRRSADTAVANGRVTIDGATATSGSQVKPTDVVCLDGVKLTPRAALTTIMLNKPVGYVCSRAGQGSATIYDLLPPEYHHLKPIGRLDKDSSGLLLLTDDGTLANELTHPSRQKVKIYEITLSKPLQPLHQQMISDFGVTLEDGLSKFAVTRLESRDMRHETREEQTVQSAPHTTTAGTKRPIHDSYSIIHDIHAYHITMHEGRNRQIRRTFAALGYTVTALHRTHFGPYVLGGVALGQWKKVA